MSLQSFTDFEIFSVKVTESAAETDEMENEYNHTQRSEECDRKNRLCSFD